jgi:DNA-binding NarL/FixJ family response regulator
MRRAATERPVILVVEDDGPFREHVHVVLEDAGYRVLEAERAEEALRIAHEERPDLVLLDVHLPGTSGYDVCRSLRDELGEIGIIFLSGSRTEMLDRAAGLSMGADDYVLKPFEPEELIARVRAVLRRVAPRSASSAAPGAFDLTPRELEVLHLLAEGLDQDEIAERLVISSKTVATHLERILGKLGARSRAQAVAVAYRERLVTTV